MDPRPSDIVHLGWLRNLGIEDVSGLRILDLGCGSGYLCEKFHQEGASKAVGVDIVAPDRVDKAPWDYHSLDLEAQDWSTHMGSQSFELILAFDIIEHLSSPFHFLKNCQELLSDDGKLVLTTPNINSWERMANPRGWSGARDEQHKTLFNRYSLDFLLGKTHLMPTKIIAPIRSLSFMGPLQPHLGGQILTLARKVPEATR